MQLDSLKKLLNNQNPFPQQKIDRFYLWVNNCWKPQIKKYDYLQKPQQGDIDYYNYKQGKNYAAGILPSCTSNGQGYILLGQESSGWSYFQGWQDKGDYNQIYTAAREASEESNGIIGNIDFFLEILNDKDSQEQIYQGCYFICLGELSQRQMDFIEQSFAIKRKKTINPCKREHKQIKWIPAQNFLNSLNDENGAIHISDEQNQQNPQQLRKFVKNCMPRYWDNIQCLKSILKGQNPFINNVSRFQEWIRGEWGSNFE